MDEKVIWKGWGKNNKEAFSAGETESARVPEPKINSNKEKVTDGATKMGRGQIM